MSTETPSSTPDKKLPMIVDIAIDNKGKKMYQVHETSKLVRKEMPTSTQFSESSSSVHFDSEDKTPVKRILGTILPSLNQKPRIQVSTDFETNHRHDLGSPFKESADPSGPMDSGSTPTSATSSTSGESEKDIWSSEVQDAFEEVLSIVPKNGLNKIKIGGRSCGRNELISDYILAKTGKYRSRKQVSSHIQVIKNMGQKKHLIDLINDGPLFSSPEEFDRNAKAFEDIFTEINLNKSLGVVSKLSLGRKLSLVPERRYSAHLLSAPPKRQRILNDFVAVKNACFSIDSPVVGLSPIFLSLQDDSPMKSLTVKENANVSNRFPGLGEFANSSVPILHTMMRIYSPLQLPSTYSIDSGLKTNYMLDFASQSSGLSSFTSVYSFGTEVLKVNENHFEVNINQPFLLKFWKCFFFQLLQQPSSLDAAFKGITVKQVIYNNSDGPSGVVLKSTVKAVLLWEFSKVDDLKDAISSTSRLFLPPNFGVTTMPRANVNYHHQQPPLMQHFPPSHLEPDLVFPVDPQPQSHEIKSEHLQFHQYQPAAHVQPFIGAYPQPGPPVFHPSANVDLAAVRSDAQFTSQEAFEYGSQFR